MAKSYAEKLRDPRWQKKRLEVLEAHNWQCELCGDKTKTLNVHHAYYLPRVDIWDYPSSVLKCLCEGCHKEITDLTAFINHAIFTSPPAEIRGLASILSMVIGQAPEVVKNGAALCGLALQNLWEETVENTSGKVKVYIPYDVIKKGVDNG